MPKTFKWSAVDWSAAGVQDGGNFVSSAKTVVSSVFFYVICCSSRLNHVSNYSGGFGSHP